MTIGFKRKPAKSMMLTEYGVGYAALFGAVIFFCWLQSEPEVLDDWS